MVGYSLPRIISIILALATLGCGVLPDISGRTRQPEEPFSGESAYAYVRYLADHIGSRPASTDKEQEAAAYIAKQLSGQKLSVQRPSFGYTAYIPKSAELRVIEPAAESITATSMMWSGSGAETAEVVDAGIGRRDDFAGGDFAGKIALMRRGEIRFGAKVANAAEAGAVGAIIYNDRQGDLEGSLGDLSKIPSVAISQVDGQHLRAILGRGKVVAYVAVDAAVVDKHSENVAGTRFGGGKKIVVLGAHYDSVDAGPGANDNASGVATVIELARVTSAKSYPFELRFVAFGAEEIGLIGSENYVHSLSPSERERIVAMLNFDMVGVGDDLKLGGVPDLASYGKAAARELGVEPGDLDERFSGASDHASFMDAGIPALMFTWEDDPNYHTKNDKSEFVRPDRLETTGKIALSVLDRLAEAGGVAYEDAEMGDRIEAMVLVVPPGIPSWRQALSDLRRRTGPEGG